MAASHSVVFVTDVGTCFRFAFCMRSLSRVLIIVRIVDRRWMRSDFFQRDGHSSSRKGTTDTGCFLQDFVSDDVLVGILSIFVWKISNVYGFVFCLQ